MKVARRCCCSTDGLVVAGTHQRECTNGNRERRLPLVHVRLSAAHYMCMPGIIIDGEIETWPMKQRIDDAAVVVTSST